mgnify:CR=1 FL=1
MENATKALLIAAAVLIAIILISLGVSIVNSAQDQINQSSNALNSAEIESFNSKFRSYEGAAVSGTKVRTLARAVIQNNQSQDDDSRKVVMRLVSSNDIQDLSQLSGTSGNSVLDKDTSEVPTSGDNSIATGNRYIVKCKTDNSGLIKYIFIAVK